jgi:hypothetical protein
LQVCKLFFRKSILFTPAFADAQSKKQPTAAQKIYQLYLFKIQQAELTAHFL